MTPPVVLPLRVVPLDTDASRIHWYAVFRRPSWQSTRQSAPPLPRWLLAKTPYRAVHHHACTSTTSSTRSEAPSTTDDVVAGVDRRLSGIVAK